MKSVCFLIVSALAVLANSSQSNYTYVPPWATLPPTPDLPVPYWNGTASINGIELWHALFGRPLDHGTDNIPVVFMHGGFANSDYFGHQIKKLLELPHSIIAIDTRAHGRSTDDLSRPLTYDLFAEDAIALMDHLGVQKFTVVSRVDRVFSYGGTYSLENINATIGESPSFLQYLDRVKGEYEQLSPTPQGYATFEQRMNAMWAAEPSWRAESFQRIPSLYSDPEAPLMWIVDGDSEDAVNRDVPHTLFNWIWGSATVLLPSVSHFAFLQDPGTFNAILERFLATTMAGN